MKSILLSFILLGFAFLPCYAAQTTLDAALKKAVADTPKITLYNRLAFMAGKPADISTIANPRLYAIAAYLFNMYITHRVYLPADSLPLEYVGVLDPLYEQTALTGKEIIQAYQKHSEEIYQYFDQILHQNGMDIFLIDPTRMKKDVHILVTAYRFPDKQPSYTKMAYKDNSLPLTEHDRNLLLPVWQKAQAEGRTKAVLFKVADLSALDNKYANNQYLQETYRWANEECEYASYLLGRQMTQAIAGNPELWKRTHIYKIKARDKESFYVLTKSGTDRFQLANGTLAPAWEYHTAILVALPEGNAGYKWIVLDSFLGGTENLLSLAQWQDKFADTTAFEVLPFTINADMDKCFKTVQQQRGNNVVIDGREYKPYPKTVL